MRVISPTADRTITTPNAIMTTLAAPSVGSDTLSGWRVRMPAAKSGPLHTVDREQIWMVTSGTLTITADGRTETVGAGQAVVLPADTARRIRTADQAAEALVTMPAEGRVTTDDEPAPRPLPWAE